MSGTALLKIQGNGINRGGPPCGRCPPAVNFKTVSQSRQFNRTLPELPERMTSKPFSNSV